MKIIPRKEFILRSGLSAAGFILFPGFFMSQQIPSGKKEKGPPLNPLLVKEFVGAAHKDEAMVKRMLEANPDLLNAVNNLGAWDWEDALGAAGHTGNSDLANFLLEKGARMTICVAAMLGKTEIVRSSISAFPYMKEAVGPHKISIMRHAKAGGENAKEVVEYLKSLGLMD